MIRRAYRSIVTIAVFLLFTSFKTSSVSGGDFDVYNPDYNYLNELITDKINEKRLKKNEPLLEVSQPLQKTALFFTRELKLTKFEQLRNDRNVLIKKVDLISWKNGFSNNMLDVIITEGDAINYQGGPFYLDKEETDPLSHLLYGVKPTKHQKEQENYQPKPIKDYSYEALAEIFAKKFLLDKRVFKCLNSGYTLFGCSCTLEKKTLGRRRIPLMKAVFILGGRRINF